MRRSRGQRWLLFAAIPGVLAILAIAVGRPVFVTASATQFDILRDVMARGGVELEPLTPNELTAVLAGPVTAEAAVAEAVGQFGKVDPPVVLVALITVKDLEPRIDRTPMYVVQLGGMNLPPAGGGPIPKGNLDPESLIHRELVVFVDAVTGKYVLSVTAR